MTNHTDLRAKPTKVGKPIDWHVLQGMCDYIDGEPYPKEYESWTQTQQNLYEEGRLAAANLLLAKVDLPRIKRKKTVYSEEIHNKLQYSLKVCRTWKIGDINPAANFNFKPMKHLGRSLFPAPIETVCRV